MTKTQEEVMLILLARQVRLLEKLVTTDHEYYGYSEFRKDLYPRLTFPGSGAIASELDR